MCTGTRQHVSLSLAGSAHGQHICFVRHHVEHHSGLVSLPNDALALGCCRADGPRTDVMMRTVSILALLPALLSCGRLVDPPLPEGAQPFAPPPVYATWWAMTEACAGVQAAMAAVQWFVVPGASAVHTGGVGDADGYWSAAGHQIVLAEAAVGDGGVVRHEMLHALTGRASHTRADFLDRCGGIVSCGGPCIAEAGLPAAPAPAVASVDPEALEVDLTLMPAIPSQHTDRGHFALIVTVRNPAAFPVVVLFPAHRGGEVARTFGFTWSGPAGGVQGDELAFDAGLAFFGAGEIKHHVFDFVIGGGLARRTLPSGTYEVSGRFAGKHVTLEAVTVGP